MTHLARCVAALLLSVLLTALGCRAAAPGEAVPHTQGLSDEQVLAVLAHRAEQVQRVMASGTLRLESQAEGSVRLEVALLASGDEQLRLRAWKLGQPVFDLTRDGDKVWLWASDRAGGGEQTAPYPVTAEHLDTGRRLLTGQLFTNAPDQIISREPFVVMYWLGREGETGDTPTAQITIDRDTQTITRCDILDPQGQVRQTMLPQRYRLIDGTPWATRVTSEAGESVFDLTLDDVELNGDIPASAFTPPRNAQSRP